MIDEQQVAFTLIDFEHLIKSLDKEGLLNDENYIALTKAKSIIENITGMVRV